MVKTRVLLVIAAAILVVLPCVHVSLAASDPAREGRAASVQAQSVCPYVPNTPSFTFAYGDVLKDGLPAPVGSAVLARSPRGDIVGCTLVTTAGLYPAMYIYGEDTTVTPSVPGMRNGETVTFLVDGVVASVSSLLLFANDRDLHRVDLAAIGVTSPVASFSGTPLAGVAPLSVSFTDTSTGSPTSWLWSFGDGGTSTAQHPMHAYASKGTYTVSLTATNAHGSSIETKTGYVTVYQPVDAGFTGAPTTGIAPLLVSFANSSVGDYSTLSWSFGDGATSADASPAHAYGVPGVYTVTLTATGMGGTDTETKVGYVTVYNPVVAGFEATPTNGTAPLSVELTSNSTGDITIYAWDFGDGETSSLPNPIHVYESAGVYSVSLTVSGPGGVDSETKEDYIVVQPLWRIYLPLVIG